MGLPHRESRAHHRGAPHRVRGSPPASAPAAAGALRRHRPPARGAAPGARADGPGKHAPDDRVRTVALHRGRRAVRARRGPRMGVHTSRRRGRRRLVAMRRLERLPRRDGVLRVLRFGRDRVRLHAPRRSGVVLSPRGLRGARRAQRAGAPRIGGRAPVRFGARVRRRRVPGKDTATPDLRSRRALRRRVAHVPLARRPWGLRVRGRGARHPRRHGPSRPRRLRVHQARRLLQRRGVLHGRRDGGTRWNLRARVRPRQSRRRLPVRRRLPRGRRAARPARPLEVRHPADTRTAAGPPVATDVHQALTFGTSGRHVRSDLANRAGAPRRLSGRCPSRV